jgi:hypothetical protein
LNDNHVYSETELEISQFSETGKRRFINTVSEYQKELFEKSIEFAKATKEKDMPLEVNSDNVRSATIKINQYNSKEKIPTSLIVGNICEYIFTAVAGIGAGNLSESWGIVSLVIGSAIAVILLTIRLIKTR